MTIDKWKLTNQKSNNQSEATICIDLYWTLPFMQNIWGLRGLKMQKLLKFLLISSDKLKFYYISFSNSVSHQLRKSVNDCNLYIHTIQCRKKDRREQTKTCIKSTPITNQMPNLQCR